MTHFESERARKHWNNCHSGKEAGHRAFHRGGRRKYIEITYTLHGKVYKFSAHRLAMVMQGFDVTSDKVDHRNGDPFDNRASNLRVATDAQNQYNHPGHRVEGVERSLPKGVVQRYGKFQAYIKADARTKYLGSFGTATEAHEAYVNAAKTYHGEFMRAA